MKVLIVGAGIGGLTLAAFLEGSNIEYDIIEKSTDWQQRGYLIGLWNNGRRILAKLGLAEKLDTTGTPMQTYAICNGKGSLLRTYSLSNFFSTYGMGLTMVSRDDLHTWLLGKVQNSVHMGVTVKSISQEQSGATVRFNTEEEKVYDLVVGADGIHSQVRKLLFQHAIEKYTNWRHWLMWVEGQTKNHARVTEYIEAGEFISTFEMGNRMLVALIAPADHSLWDDVHSRIERLKTVFRRETLLVPAMFQKIRDEEILPTDLMHITLRHWIKGNAVLLGDAAHGFEPHAGMGGSMAMEDAYVLAAELLKVSTNYPMSEALKNYERKRKARVHIAENLTNKMRMWAQIKSRPVRTIVNFFAPYIPESYFVRDYHRLLKQEI